MRQQEVWQRRVEYGTRQRRAVKLTYLTALGKGWKTVPACLPFMIPGIAWGSLEEQMTIVQPAAVAILAAVSFVTMPPVPHCESLPLVSTYTPFFACYIAIHANSHVVIII